MELENDLNRLMNTPSLYQSGTVYLLIQGHVLDTSKYPHTLMYSLLDDGADFQVAVGCIDEFGKPEVVGIIARAHAAPGCAAYRVCSALDDYNRLIGITGSMADFIRKRLEVYWRQKRFDDLCNLPMCVTIRGEL